MSLFEVGGAGFVVGAFDAVFGVTLRFEVVAVGAALRGALLDGDMRVVVRIGSLDLCQQSGLLLFNALHLIDNKDGTPKTASNASTHRQKEFELNAQNANLNSDRLRIFSNDAASQDQGTRTPLQCRRRVTRTLFACRSTISMLPL